MVVWRPSVARMVYLHTGTMGVHRACLLSFECEKLPPPRPGPRRKTSSLSYAFHPCPRTNWRAPGIFGGTASRGGSGTSTYKGLTNRATASDDAAQVCKSTTVVR